jgi:hypothetical protein
MARDLHTVEIKNLILNNVKLLKSTQLNGCFMTLTREMVEKIGYYKILPNRYGHEHTEYTLRAIREGFASGFMDLDGSDTYIKLHGLSRQHQSENGLCSDVVKIDENAKVAFSDNSSDYVPFED